MQRMSGADLHFAVAELAQFEGKRIAKIRKTDSGIYLFKIGAGELLFEPGMRLHATMQLFQAAQSPDGFVSYLRKRLEGKTASSIAQHGNDRIVEVETKSKEMLVLEIFRKGNVILVLEDGTIDACLMKDEAGGRRIAKGEKYSYPKATQYEARLPKSPRFFVKEDDGGAPVSFSCEGSQGRGREFPSFSQAADYYYANQRGESEAEQKHAARLAGLKERLRSQKEALSRIEAEREAALAAGKALQERHAQVEELLSLVKAMKKAGKSDSEISREIARLGARLRGAEVELETGD